MRYLESVPSAGTVTTTVEEGETLRSATEQEYAPVIVVWDTPAPERPNAPEAAPGSWRQTSSGRVTAREVNVAVSVIALSMVTEIGLPEPATHPDPVQA